MSKQFTRKDGLGDDNAMPLLSTKLVVFGLDVMGGNYKTFVVTGSNAYVVKVDRNICLTRFERRKEC
ncbi:MAG: hypothetical protein LBU65_01265 [Planctomycetaceae bacterium]|nr:hypothetical protein [Planctomycetaceae bacterium]